MNIKTKSIILFVSIAVAVVTCDILTKIFVYGNDCGVIKGFISIYSTENTGAAWSIFAGKQTLLIAFTSVFLIILVVLNVLLLIKKAELFKGGKGTLYIISMGFIFGGALGNLYDRVFLGYVRDFIKFDFMNFPVFNIADSFLCIGVALVFVYFLIAEITDAKQKKGRKNGIG